MSEIGEEEIKGEEKELPGEKQGGEADKGKKHFRTIEEVEIDRFHQFRWDSKQSMYVPRALDLSNKGLTDIYPLKAHPYLLYLRLSNNRLTNASLKNLSFLPDLTSLYLNRNKITSTTLTRLEKLQLLDLENNPIKVVEPIDQPNLQTLILNKTKITTLQYVGINSTPKLLTLSASHCYLKTMIGDYALYLKCLYLSYNELKRVEGLEGLVNLKILHLRSNRISKLSGLTVGLDSLEYLNLRENEVTDANELKKIQTLPSLRIIILKDNPVDDEMGSDIRPMVLMYSLELKRINKDLTDEEEVKYARSLIYEVEAEYDFRGGEGGFPAEE